MVALAPGCIADGFDPGGEMGRKELAVTYCAEGETLEGIDVSKWQGEIDWDRVAGAGIRFAFIRATHGVDVIDEWFDENWRRAREVGIVRGAYQFYEASQDPIEQADVFIDMVGELAPGDLPPVVDIESPDGNPGVAAYQDEVRTWLDRVEGALGIPPIIYTGKYYWNDRLGGTDEFSDHPLWEAWWNDACPDTPSGWSRWTFWQYSSTGRIAGIGGDVDRDRFDGSIEDLNALAAGGVCGDGSCTAGESTLTCEADCPPCQVIGPEGGILDEAGPCFRGGGDPQFLRRVDDGWESSLIWTHATELDRAYNFGEWRLSFAEAGRYRIEAYTKAPWAESRQAAYQITHAGVTDVIAVDQTAVDGWTPIGELDFAAGHGQLVRVDDNTGEPQDADVQLVFDALQFTRLDAPVDPGPDDPPAADPGPEPGPDPDAEPDVEVDADPAAAPSPEDGGLAAGCSTGGGSGHAPSPFPPGWVVVFFAVRRLGRSCTMANGPDRSARG
ncbi:MAG: hypothetical protein HYY06_25200 [Deltaproteobacteria bacterium]|nr:hypothetical protein [Deltaproteobacteria bacterium]